jgi:SNF2 family DNA or RNA helicase
MTQALGPFKRQPREKQLEALRISADREYFALFMEQRTGKSQVALDTAAHAFRQGKISALLIIAPNGVHRNWVSDEIPAVLADDTRYRCVTWKSGRMETVARRTDLRELLVHDGLAVLAVNIDALLSTFTKKVINAFLARRPTMTIIDESLDISSPGAKRTKTALAIGRRSVVRRILDGTPVDATPLGLYSQTNFLFPGVLGCSTFAEFKTTFAEYEERTTRGGQVYAELKGFRNLDMLKERLDRFSFRVTRADCADLPPKVYEKWFFPLPVKHRKIYDQLRREFVIELEGAGTVDGQMILTRYLRLQQITSNFVKTQGEPVPCPFCAPADRGTGFALGADDCEHCDGYGIVPASETLTRIDAADPRLAALDAVVAKLRGQGIIWAKFRSDYETLRAWALKGGETAVFYHGSIPPDDRADAVTAFQSGRARLFVGNPRAGGRGLDLSAANWVIYYSHDWPLRWRRQSEDRAQSLAKRDAVLYVDLIAEDTVDEKIITALRDGRNLSDLVTGDKPENWI